MRGPQGRLPHLPKIIGTGLDAQTLADGLFEEVRVACPSGAGFGRHGEGYLRFSYANSREHFSLALERMDQLFPPTVSR